MLSLRAGILIAIVTAAAMLSAVPSLQRISIVVVVGASALLGWLRSAPPGTPRAATGFGNELRRLNETLEAQVEGRTAELRDSNARMRSIIDSAVDGIIVIDEHGRIESFNPGAERLFGYPQTEVLGRNVNLLMPVPVPRGARRLPARYLATGVAKIIGIGREVTGRRRDGTRLPAASLGRRDACSEESGSSPAFCTT